MKRFLSLLVAAVALFLPLPAMSVCNVPQPRLVRAEYFASQLVVEATLARTEKDDPVFPSAYVYTLRVNNVLRGKVRGTIRVYESNDSGRATFDWVSGREYLLFLFYSATEKSWKLDGCGNSGSLSGADMALSEIAAIKTARGGGIIQGVVRGSEQAPETTIAGVHVEAQGKSGRFPATTNQAGEFQIKVPAGRYVVRASKDGIAFDTAVFSYEDPGRIRIEPGGCAQVEFAEVERPTGR
jgi:hypothetical protein